MKKNNQNSNQKEMAFLLGFKSLSGIISSVASIGMLLSAFAPFCPFCSYNPTVIDDLKRNVMLTDLSKLTLLALLFWVAAIVTCLFCILSLNKQNWREKPKQYVVFPILVCVFLLISYIIMAVACVFYEIPESEFSGLETKMEAGFYLYTIGCAIFAITFFFFSLTLRNLALGKISMEEIALGKKKKEKEVQKDGSSLAEKLKELQKLKDEGLITEAEFLAKKEELLEEYK